MPDRVCVKLTGDLFVSRLEGEDDVSFAFRVSEIVFRIEQLVNGWRSVRLHLWSVEEAAPTAVEVSVEPADA